MMPRITICVLPLANAHDSGTKYASTAVAITKSAVNFESTRLKATKNEI